MSAILDAFSTFARDLFVFASACLLLLWAVSWALSIYRGEVEPSMYRSKRKD